MADTMHRVDVENVSDGPRMFNSVPPRLLQRGETAEGLEISAAELESMRRFEQFKIGGKHPLDRDGDGKPGGSNAYVPPALTGKNKAQLLAIAEAEGVTVEDDATNPEILAAIEAKREG